MLYFCRMQVVAPGAGAKVLTAGAAELFFQAEARPVTPTEQLANGHPLHHTRTYNPSLNLRGGFMRRLLTVVVSLALFIVPSISAQSHGPLPPLTAHVDVNVV